MRALATVVSALGALAAAACVLAGPATAAIARPDLSYDLGSPVADPGLNSLDLYMPDGTRRGEARPVVVYVHGGGWRAGDKANQIGDKVRLFTEAGYVFVSVNYRLSPLDVTLLDPARVRFPDHPRDVGEAIGWLDRNVARYGGDPARLLLIGHSAGAHLVSLVSTDPSYVRAYGVEPWQLIGTVSLDTAGFDIEARATGGRPRARLLYENAFGTAAENAATGAWAAASPIRLAGPADPRFLLVTQARAAARLAENRAMASALGQDPAGVFAAPYDHAGINRAVGSPTDASGQTQAITSFMARMVAEARGPVARLARRPPRLVRTPRRRARVVFVLRTRQPGATFRCRLGAGPLRPCSRRVGLRVAGGRHVFRYRAVSAGGRPGPAGRHRFRVLARRSVRAAG